MEPNEAIEDRALELAITAYEGYGEAVGFKNYQGLAMPIWEQLTPEIRSAWVKAAIAVTKKLA